MAVLPNYTTFRWYFAEKKLASITATFADANPDTIARTAGSYATDGAVAGMVAIPSSSVSNDGARFLIDTVAALTLTLDDGEAVTAEAATAGVTLTMLYLSPDGYEEWPGPRSAEAGRSSNLVRANGFDDGITGYPVWFSEAALIDLTVNALAADAVSGVDEYDWYLSQRTDDPSKQFLQINQVPGFSGSVQVAGTSLATSELELTPGLPLNPDKMAEMWRHSYVYCRRRSDGAIQWLDLHRALMGATV